MSRGIPPETFGDVIARLRKLAGLKNQGALADRVGRGRDAVQKWETNESLPDRRVFPKLAEVLRVPVEALEAIAGLREPWATWEELLAVAEEAERIAGRLRTLAIESGEDPSRVAADHDEIARAARHGEKRVEGE